jgi:hypothetical protein
MKGFTKLRFCLAPTQNLIPALHLKKVNIMKPFETLYCQLFFKWYLSLRRFSEKNIPKLLVFLFIFCVRKINKNPA